MLIRQIELEVPIDEPFRNDVLDRKELEPPLTQFITQASSSLVLALDGSWGSGKTTFLRMWQVKLTEVGHTCLYLNAWQTDFAQEPLVAVVGELSNAIEKLAPKGKKGENLRRQMKSAKTIAESIAKRSLPVVVKLATLGMLDTMLDTKDVIEKILSDFTSNIVEDRIKDYENGKSEIEEFRKSLAALAEEVNKLKSDISAKVVIIIDELDRCRPIYAVQLLERIKHLFDVPGVVFILGINRSQLNHSIQALYGADFNAREYLKRFIDIDYQMPEPKKGNYCSYLFKSFGIDELITNRKTKGREDELKNLKTYLGGLMSAAGMSLREQGQTVARLRVILQTIPVSDNLFEITLSLLTFFREWNFNIYTRIVEGKTGAEEILSLINELPYLNQYPQAVETHNEIDMYRVEAHLLLGLTELGVNPSRIMEYKQIANSVHTEPDWQRANQVLDFMHYLNINYLTAGFKITAKRLALTQSFVS